MKKAKLKRKLYRTEDCLKRILAYHPREVVKDEFAYDRLLKNIKDAARIGLGR